MSRQDRSGEAGDPPGSPEPRDAPDPSAALAPADPSGAGARPLIERLGLGLIALVIAVIFAGLAVGAFVSGEVFLATMAGIGALMTVWAGAATVRR